MAQRNRRAIFLCAVLLLAGLLCWSSANRLAARMAGYPEQASLLLYGKEQTLEAAARVQLEEEQGNFAFARQEQNIAVTAPLLGKEATVTLVETYGDASLLMPGRTLLTGHYPQAFTNQCAVDQETAARLWGSSQVLGNDLLIDNERYTVTGVFRSPEPLLVAGWNGTEEYQFAYASYLPAKGAAFPIQEQATFLLRSGLPTPVSTMYPGRDFAAVLQLAKLPLLLLGMLVVEAPVRQIGRKGASWFWLRWTVRFGAFYLFGKALQWRLPISPEQLPTRWSDFSFWKKLLDGYVDKFAVRWGASGFIPHFLELTESIYPAALLTALSCLCILWSWRFAKQLSQPA